ncbi:flagellar export chaperone FliS [Bacillus massilinigeriensis]|uniref:flagellar export chaperone FliS n=1 Tax=Bacillus mediterraneensis TaxID=1805474 RepID=UPI0008F8F12C|nr:flagellar export chaperone FliS [Bacillus mediterraneensis]
MAVKNPYESYQQNSVTTASPGELTLMLYNGIIKFTALAKKAMESKDISGKNTNILKSQDIVRELMVTLDEGADVAKDMMSLYDYMYRRLIEANIKNDPAILVEVEALAAEFRDTWKQVIQINRQMQYGESRRA